MLRGSVLLCALLFSAPSLYDALGPQTVSLESAVIRFLIALVVCGVLVGLVRAAFSQKPEAAETDNKDSAKPSTKSS